MVRRSTPDDVQKSKGKGKKKSTGTGDRAVQQPGKLMLNNPTIPPELDEDIDDDLAFNSEDELLYGQYFANKPEKKTKKKKKSRASAESDSDEDFVGEQFKALSKADKAGRHGDDDEALYNYHEDGQSSDDNEDYIDLSDMLDMSLKEEKKKNQAKKGAEGAKKPLTTAAAAANDSQASVKKRRGAKTTEEAESLLGTLSAGEDGSAPSYGAAIRNIVRQADASKEEEAVKRRLEEALRNKHNLLSLDADDVTKNRLTRREVRNVVEKNLERYKPLLRELSASKHLQFPMKAPESTPTPSSIGGIVAAAESRLGERTNIDGAAPQNEGPAVRLASKMNALLQNAGLAKQQRLNDAGSPDASALGEHVQFEHNDEAAEEGRGPDESRQAPSTSYMAKLKSMLAFENSRRRRFNKIKSKTYRRILRKEKDREKERRQKAFELLHPELARKRLAEQLLKARAEERVTQKHKNTSAWVKRAKRFAQYDENAKDAVNEQLSIHQRLMQKMEQDAGEEHYEHYLKDADANSEASSEEERVVDRLLSGVAEETAGSTTNPSKTATSVLWSSVDDAENEAGSGDTPAPMAKARAELKEMRFMKAAREREEKSYEEQLTALKEDIRRYQNGETLSDVGEAEDGESTSAGRSKNTDPTAATVPGRKSFKDAADKSGRNKALEVIQLRSQTGINAEGGKTDADNAAGTKATAHDAWGSESEDALTDEDGEGARRPSAKSTEGTRPLARSVAGKTSEFAGDRVAAVPKKSASTRVTILPSKLKKRDRDAEGGEAEDNGGEELKQPSRRDASEDDENDLPEASEDLRLHQEYLISRAFAHDEVDEDFLKEKQSQVEAIMKPEDKNKSLPGWGEWGGEDERLNQRHQEKLAHNAVQKQIEKSFLMKSRADATLDHVIINHDGVELVPDRMTLHMVPRPFSNAEEFARSMRQPVGPEWTSALSFKEGVQPRVEVRQGQAVTPLDLSLRQKKSKTKRRKTEK